MISITMHKENVLKQQFLNYVKLLFSPSAVAYCSLHNKGFPEKYCNRSLLSFFSFILRFWNQILTCRSVRFSILDN